MILVQVVFAATLLSVSDSQRPASSDELLLENTGLLSKHRLATRSSTPASYSSGSKKDMAGLETEVVADWRKSRKPTNTARSQYPT